MGVRLSGRCYVRGRVFVRLLFREADEHPSRPSDANYVDSKLDRPPKVGSYQRIGWVCTTCTATCGSGARTRIGSARVIRGGSWSSGASVCRAAIRGVAFTTRGNDFGFRLARVSSGSQERLNDTATPPPGETKVDRTQHGPNSLGMRFVHLPKGTFYIGGGGGKRGRKTEIKADFEIAVYTVTQGQWQAVMGNNPSWFSRAGGGKDKVQDISDEDLEGSSRWNKCRGTMPNSLSRS